MKQYVTVLLLIVITTVILFIFVIPVPSFRRDLNVINNTTNVFEITITTFSKKGYKHKIKLASFEQADLPYYSGDYGAIQEVSVTLTTKNLQSGKSATNTFMLPITPVHPRVAINQGGFQILTNNP